MNPIVKFSALVLTCLPSLGIADMVITDDMAPYEICALCHSLDGNSRMSKFPKLAGQPTGYIEKQLADFIAGIRANDGGQMASIVTEIAPEDIPVVAQWYANQAAPRPFETDQDTTTGESAFTDLGCAVCHDTAQTKDDTPHLTAQHADYLAKQMQDFRDGLRGNDPDGLMQEAMRSVSDAQINAMAMYLSATPRDTQ